MRKAQVGDVAATAGSTSGPSHTENSNPPPDLMATNLILNQLTAIQGQISSIDERVRKNRKPLYPARLPTELFLRKL